MDLLKKSSSMVMLRVTTTFSSQVNNNSISPATYYYSFVLLYSFKLLEMQVSIGYYLKQFTKHASM